MCIVHFCSKPLRGAPQNGNVASSTPFLQSLGVPTWLYCKKCALHREAQGTEIHPLWSVVTSLLLIEIWYRFFLLYNSLTIRALYYIYQLLLPRSWWGDRCSYTQQWWGNEAGKARLIGIFATQIRRHKKHDSNSLPPLCLLFKRKISMLSH